MKRYKKQMDETENSTIYKRTRKRHICKQDGRCDFCGYHSGENDKRPKRKAKPKYKDKR